MDFDEQQIAGMDMEMNDPFATEMESVFSPDTLARPDYTPFAGFNLEGKKFIEIGGEELDRLSKENGFDISDEQKEKGVILIDKVGAMTGRHVDLLAPFGVNSLDDADKVKLRNAGTIMNPLGKSDQIKITQYTADLNVVDSSGSSIRHRSMPKQDMLKLHEETAKQLKDIYGDQFDFQPLDLM